jgi:hypothetical protein
MTKLKTQKTFLKGPRMKINNKKIQGLKLKKKKTNKHFLWKREKIRRKKKKSSVTNRSSSIVTCHTRRKRMQ